MSVRADVIRALQVSPGTGGLAMQDVTVERRVAPRYPVILIAEVMQLPEGTRFAARSSDLSRTGCYLDTLNPLPKGTPVRLTLTRGKDTFETNATVMYEAPRLGMGLSFEQPIPAKQLVLLERWLAEAAK